MTSRKYVTINKGLTTNTSKDCKGPNLAQPQSWTEKSIEHQVLILK